LFERYTERARRSIFFGRYEAATLGSSEIASEHLLLGILREDKTVAIRIGIGSLETIRNELARKGVAKEKIAMSVDLPLSQESKRALGYGAEEAERLGHKQIDAPHLLLGLMRVQGSLAAQLLQQHGMEIDAYRSVVAEMPPSQEAGTHRASITFEPRRAAPVAAKAPSLEPIITALWQLLEPTATRLEGCPDTFGDQRLKRKNWTRKEALGHLIDWAMAHQQWVTQAILESKVKAAAYPDDAAVTAQHYADFPWQETVDLWASLNGLLIHTLLRVPEEKAAAPCKIGVAEPVPLSKLIEAYIAHCEDVIGQILAHL